jgi:CheY-like chemotaxis protein
MADPRKKILCIEDDRETIALIAEVLTEWGFEPIVAYSGTNEFAEIIKRRPDLVLCDINMPHMSGFEVLERLNEIAHRFGHIPFVFLTAMADRENELRGRRLGADGRLHHQADRLRRAPHHHQCPAGPRRAQRDLAEADGSERPRDRDPDVGRPRQDIRRNRKTHRPVQKDDRLSPRQCARQVGGRNAHRGGAEGGDRPPDPAVISRGLQV